MTTAGLTERPRRLFADLPSNLGGADVRHLSRRSDGGGLTLGRKLDRVWEGLHAAGAAECPLCQGSLATVAGEAGSRCGDCGTQLF